MSFLPHPNDFFLPISVEEMEELRIAERVSAGIAWLDQNVSDWRNSISLEKLDIGHPKLCILGQIFGDFTEAKNRLLGNREAIAYGFLGSMTHWEDRGEYTLLNDEWLRRLAA